MLKKIFDQSYYGRLFENRISLLFIASCFIVLLSVNSFAGLISSEPTCSTITISWTAPGDDGDVGIANQYDIRYSTSMITEANWNLAIQVTGEPSPQPAGSLEAFTITGLEPSTLYYLAIKAADEVPNWSNMSNVIVCSTLDIIPPAPIDDILASTGVNAGELNLVWTAPGDDSLTGTASAYIIKASTEMITESNWDSAATISDPPAPLEPGEEQTMIITGLIPAQLYYIAIKTVDDCSNISGISNVDSASAMFLYGSDIDDHHAALPTEFGLAQNYPNPFNPSTKIDFGLPEESNVRLEIYNALGQKVVTLIDDRLPAGYYSKYWHGKDSYNKLTATGIYFYRIQADDFIKIKKMILLK